MALLIPAGTQILGGLELGGVPIATMLSSITSLPALFVCKEAKTYGTCRLAEGGNVDGRTVTLVEDIVTTGGAVRAATVALRERGAVVTDVVCTIDRSRPDEDPLADLQITTTALFTRADLDAHAARS
ncbi:orotate phosphoribosyltransferase [Rudaeicoccus suwonensis]|uniref:Orotate phosphoribosyltransferase n=1 Tax=Rudaeicoccus suwonensis TaxID=657409 RepID=A0A561E8H9_9MICO|nr:phosphoribosyltransferase family protein [Rudaeicoccus suwonensis]TWE11928.1 orotate phosphoribosyltransferase [Rudaeicoccus suwonensis]